MRVWPVSVYYIKTLYDKLIINLIFLSIVCFFFNYDMHNFQIMMDVNYFGSVFATRAVIAEMKARQQGRVVFISSQAGQLGLFGFTGYSAAKFALRGLAEALQMEVG